MRLGVAKNLVDDVRSLARPRGQAPPIAPTMMIDISTTAELRGRSAALPIRGVGGASPRPQSVFEELGKDPGERAELDRGRTRHSETHPNRDLGAWGGAGGYRLGVALLE